MWSRGVAACDRETPLVAGHRGRRADTARRLDVSERGVWADSGNAARGDRHGPAPAAGPASGTRCRAPRCGSIGPCFGARSLATAHAGIRAPNSRLPGCRHHAGNWAGRLFAKRDPNAGSAHSWRVISDVQGNEFTSDLRYRGFTASPLQGTPQGLAVYMQGIRVNEAFGDTVNWDLIPTIAIGRADVWTNNPAFGLNALGGAISFQMKDGFTYRGTEFDASGGSYGRVCGSLQYGIRNGEWALYFAAQGLKDDGWRYQSPSRIARFYGDLGWKGTDAEVHLVASAADNYFGVIGPTPVELLNNDYRSIFTWPQTTKNQAQLLALNGRYAVTDHWTVQSNLYLRNSEGPRRRQRSRGRSGQSAVQYVVPGKRRIPHPTAGEFPDSQRQQPADQLPTG
jgi:hypothetical protein